MFPRAFNIPEILQDQITYSNSPLQSTSGQDSEYQNSPNTNQQRQNTPLFPEGSGYTPPPQSITIPVSIPATSPPPPSVWSQSQRITRTLPSTLENYENKSDPVWDTPSIPDDVFSGFSDDSSIDGSASVIKPHHTQPNIQQTCTRIASDPNIRRSTRTNKGIPAPRYDDEFTPYTPPALKNGILKPILRGTGTELCLQNISDGGTSLAPQPDVPKVAFNELIEYREPSTITSSSSGSSDTELPDVPTNQDTSSNGRLLQSLRDRWIANQSTSEDGVSIFSPTEELDAQSEDLEMAMMVTDDEPRFLKQATTGPNSDEWCKAIQNELAVLERNNTWEVVDKPADRKIIGSKWVFKIKRDAMGNIEKYKARLVAKGFSQVEGLDYDELFAPVVRFDSLRLLIALSAHKGWVPAQMDVTAAFLYPNLTDEIFMHLPEGLKQPGKVARLRKCIYGLKQSPKEWYERLSSTLQRLEFKSSNFDPCVFIHQSETFFIAVYVDDLSLFGPPGNLMNQVKQTLSSEFEMKDLGPLHWLLGLEIIFSNRGIELRQTAYIEKILQRFGMDQSHPCSLPIDPNFKPDNSLPTCNPDDIRLYQSIIGSLMYAVSATRPDLCYSVTYLSQFNHSPTIQHIQAAKRALRYLNGTKNLGLFYPSNTMLELKAFSDSDYANCPITRKSISGNIVKLSSATISWRSKKQKSVSTSTAEAEYQALSLATKQLIWTANAIRELTGPLPKTPIIYCDNKAAIDIAVNQKISDRSKHIDVHYHFIREQIERGTLFLLPVSSANNLSDICTKGLPGQTFKDLTRKILGINEGGMLKS